MKRYTGFLFTTLLVFALATLAFKPIVLAAEYSEVWVDDDFTPETPGWGITHFNKIKDGIDIVTAPGTVHVAEGTYYENISLKSAVDVIGEDGAFNTIIDGGNSGLVVLAAGISSTTTLDGFTITNGNSEYGGGMQSGAHVVVSNCIFEANTATYGGGMHCILSSPTLTGCTFTNNTATYGGGMASMSTSYPLLTSCVFEANTATYGGGMYNDDSPPKLTNCIFEANLATTGGGGMYNNDSSPALVNCIFEANTAAGGGGMSNMMSSSPVLTNSVFKANEATNGGGMYNDESSSPALVNCIFEANTAPTGGGMCNRFSSLSLTNCTFYNNMANEGGGVYNVYCSVVTLTNCILWENGDEILDIVIIASEVTYCDVQGGYTGTGNINQDPLFINAVGGDLHLQMGSPCLDAGNNNAVPPEVTEDFDGNPRFIDMPDVPDTGNGTPPIVDMGAYETCAPGDANGDGDINVLDMTKVARIILQMDSSTLGADCNQDEVVNVLDMTCIARRILGLD